MTKPDYRSKESEPYRKLYKTYRWQKLRLAQLGKEPLCFLCKEQGRTTVATVCHHLDARKKKDPAKFFDGPFRSVCAPCHDSDIQSQEKGGKPKIRLGLDGWPV